MKPLAPNTLLQNRYLIVHLIGKGGMGEVYLAVDQRLGSAVALKRTFFSDDETLGNAFEREARTLARLRHAVLPKVSDHFIENENQYLVMEHISGDDLSKRLEATQKPFPLSWVLFWADQLLDALSYLHANEPPIIHRDIKPQNLKLTAENNIILLDFGLSKNSLGETRISSAGSEGYTPHYASMEQIRGTGTSPRSDIYSLSATLYQLLTNKVPPDSLSRADALLNGSKDLVEPLENVNAEVSKAVADVILKGMAVSQEQRFTSAREMQRELRDAYAQLQKGMAAQTVAFSAQGETLAQDAAAGKTEPMAAASNESQPPLQSHIQTQFMPTSFDDEISQGETVPYNAPPTESQEPDFDKTLAYDSPPQEFTAKQSDIKTEVFSGDFAAAPETVVEEKPQTEENFTADATMPIISSDVQTIEDKQAVTEVNFVPTGTSDGEVAAAANSIPTRVASQPANSPREDYGQADIFEQNKEQFAQQKPKEAAFAHPVSQPTPAAHTEKKPKGKGLAIAGGLAALLFLAIGAAGVGWYFYNNQAAVITSETPTPTPESTIESPPTPQETLAETNTNTNTNVTVANPPANTNNQQEITKTETPGVTPKPAATTQPSVVRPTPKKTETSTAGTPKTTPARTPKKNDRTDILQ